MTDLKFSKYQRSNRKAMLVSSAVSGILAMASMQAALAADEGPSATAAKDEAPAEVVVTGSRIVRRDYDASSPLMTVPEARFEQSAQLSVESVLNEMTQFTPDQTQFSTQGQIQTSPSVSLGIGTADLRGLGTNRTLVLIDGRRAQPANAALVVDLNTIPSAAIERVEVITGGASSTYGADALAGVVNFVLKDHFSGLSLDLQGGTTQELDASETRFSALTGMNSPDGKGNVMVGVEWYNRGNAYQADRSFYRDGWVDPNNAITTSFPSMPGFAAGTANAGQAVNLPSQAAVDSLFPQYAPGTISPNNTFYFNSNGTAFVRTANGTPGFNASQLGQPITGSGFYGLIAQKNGTIAQVAENGSLSTPLQRRSVFVKAHYDITDQIQAYTQANFSHIEVHTFSAGPPPAVGGAWGGSIPNTLNTTTGLYTDQAVIPAGLQTLLNSRANPNANWTLNRGLDFLGGFGPSNSSDVFQILAGLKGGFTSNDWTWDVYASTGETNTNNTYSTLPSVQQWQALVGQPNFGQGANLTSPQGGNYAINCTTGLPIYYGTTASTSQNCINGIVGDYKSLTKLSQQVIEADLQGGLMKLPAGQLRFALGADNRRNDFNYNPSNPQSSYLSFPLGLFVSNPTNGSTQVSEVYGELLVPVISKVNLELGYRESDYNSKAGYVATWKALLDYRATDWLRFRGGYQVANRAPNTGELYQSQTTIFDQGFTGGDPCGSNTTSPWGNVATNPNRLKVQQLCQALIGNATSNFGAAGSATANNYLAGTQPFTGINEVSVGNASLNAEKGETWTAGLVLQNPFGIPGLSGSVDWYNIKVLNAIGTFTGLQIYQNCFNAAGASNPNYSANDPGGFCSLIQRDPTGGTGTVSTTYLNTGFIKTSGEDIELDYRVSMPFGGSMYFNNQLSVLGTYVTQTTLSSAPIQWYNTQGQGGQYKYRWNGTTGYNFDTANKANLGLRIHYLPSIRDATYATLHTTTVLPAHQYVDFDLFGSINVFGNWQLRAGVDNLFYAQPVVTGATPLTANSTSTNAGYYDILGRRFYVGVKVQF